ncbi:MAG: trypsin-like peptidase domain-containing protein, partial [Clostridia bacterium]|nr:trypsin-like peptidase domain-containing protein [Clostridia bacterium]
MEEYNKSHDNRFEQDKEDINALERENSVGDMHHETTASGQAEEHYNYHWHDDDFAPAISGKVSEKHALSLYKPKVKRRLQKAPILAAVISAVVTSALCCGIFAATFGAFRGEQAQKKPDSNMLSINGAQSHETATPAASGGQMTIPDIYDKVSPAVVSIVSTAQSGGSLLQSTPATSGGSGVILTADGYIVTNNHVVDGASIITVKTTANQTLTAQVVGKDARTDLAILKVDCDTELPFAELGDSSLLRVGDVAIAIGNPVQEALASTLTVGHISAINRTMVIEDRQMTMLQTDAAINPGNSGGALINIYGQVIGINTAKSTGYDVEGIGFAIPINEAIPVVESIIEHGYVKGRPLVGMTGIDVTERIAKANNLPVVLYVESV